MTESLRDVISERIHIRIIQAREFKVAGSADELEKRVNLERGEFCAAEARDLEGALAGMVGLRRDEGGNLRAEFGSVEVGDG